MMEYSSPTIGLFYRKEVNKMTNYYYLASDKKMRLGNGSVDFTIESDAGVIPGFDYLIQLEIFNGVRKRMGIARAIAVCSQPHRTL